MKAFYLFSRRTAALAAVCACLVASAVTYSSAAEIPARAVVVAVNSSDQYFTANLAPGAVEKGSQLRLTAQPNVKLYYTTDGTRPTQRSSVYSTPITIKRAVIITVVAEFRGTMLEPVSYTFTIQDPLANLTPASTPAPTPGPTPGPASQPIPDGWPKWRDGVWSVRYITGYADGTFRPEQPATRYEVVDALIRLVHLGGTENAVCDLTDVPTALAPNIARLQALGIISGMGDGTFQGKKSLTRAEFCKIMCVTMQLPTDPYAGIIFTDTVGHWGTPYVGALTKGGYLTGYPDGSFQPDKPITRAEMVAIINRVVDRRDVPGTGITYSDVRPGHWAYADIQNACLGL